MQVILTPTQYQLFKTTEPPLPVGGLFQRRFYDLVDSASATERGAAKRQEDSGAPR